MPTTKIQAGTGHRLGATWDGCGTNFALFSAGAEQVEVCLFDPESEIEIKRYRLPEVTDDVWHGYIPDIMPGALYGYRVYGKYEPANGDWFNPHKLLIDPYARKLSADVELCDLHFTYANRDDPYDGVPDQRDNAKVVPKCIVVDEIEPCRRSFSGFGDTTTLIYEAHVKGLTRQHPAIDAAEKGTYKACAHAAIIQHLQQLSVTCIEFLPLHSFGSEASLKAKGLHNYWGYNTLSFFTLQRAYAHQPERALDEFRQMIEQLHQHDLQVLLDVVYNHTIEGDYLGPTLSFRGIDNRSYYRLDRNNHYLNHSGCGNTLKLSHPRVLELVMSSLRYWAENIGVDGFRFDLATTLGRDQADRFNPDAAFFKAISQDPVLQRVKLIAEPWDIGPDGYQTGRFASPWSQWNDIYRDTVRGFWRDDGNRIDQLANCLLASSLQFEHSTKGRRSWATINFVTSHDGFTLRDLVSYEDKHNHANGENNDDGHGNNLSANYGHEGPTDAVAINAARDQQRRNLVTTLYLSQGVPMILAGDEFGNSQNGNNNAYCQDNPTAWLDWAQRPADADFLAFVSYLGKLRKQHSLLRQSRYLHSHTATDEDGLPAVSWHKMDASPMQPPHWHDSNLGCIALLLAGRSESLLLIFNAAKSPQNFNLAALEPAPNWYSLLDTRHSEPALMRTKLESTVTVAATSILVAVHNH